MICCPVAESRLPVGSLLPEESAGDRRRIWYCDPLLLPSRQLNRIMMQPLFQTDGFQEVCCAILCPVHSRQLQRNQDVFQSGEGGDEMKGLKDVADMIAAVLGKITLAHPGDVRSV